MALSFVGLNAASAASVSLPAFQLGDLALVHTYRDGSNTAPSLPAGWTNAASSGGANNSSRIGYRVLQSGDSTTGTWTNATEIAVMVLRGQDAADPIGTVANLAANSDQLQYWAVDLEDTSGLSWVVGFAGHRTATDVNTKAVSGMTTRSGAVGALGAHTAENVSSFAISSYATTVNASASWRSFTIEVRAAIGATTTGTARVSLASGSIPATRTEHKIVLRARKTDAAHVGSLKAQLYEGATARSAELTSSLLTASFADHTLAVPDADAASIGSYGDLELRLWGVSSTGTPTVFEVAEALLQLPLSVAGQHFGISSLPLTVTIDTAGAVQAPGTSTTGVAEISLGSGFVPTTRTDHAIVVRARKTNAAHTATLRTRLYEGVTPRSAELESAALTTSLADYSLAIPDVDAATIGSYDDLAVHVWGYSSVGDAAVFEIAELELQLPLAGTGGNVEGAVVLSSTALISVGASVPVYPGGTVFPTNLASVKATGTITAAAGVNTVTGISVLPLVFGFVSSGSQSGERTGQVLLTAAASLTAAGVLEATGQTLVAATATVTVGGASVQDVVGDAVVSATASVTVAGVIPEEAPPANFIDLAFDMPDLGVMIAFASAPLDSAQTYTGVSDYSRGQASKRGRQFELERTEAGEMEFLLSNRDGRFNPENTASPYFPDLKPTRRVRWAMRWPTTAAGIVYDLFTGFLTGYPQEYPHLGYDSVVRQRAVDAFMALALAKLRPGTTTLAQAITTAPSSPTTETVYVASTGLPMPQGAPFEITIHDETLTVTAVQHGVGYVVTRGGSDATFHALGSTVSTDIVSFGQAYTGTRITQLLAEVGYTSNLDIDPGNSLLAATEDVAGSDPLSHILGAAEAENGRFFVAKDGRLVFRERHWFYKNELTARATFGDAAGEVHYSDVKVTDDDEKIWNIVRITPASGNTQEARDEASIADHFERVLEKSWPLADDNEASAAAQYLVQRYSRAQKRVSELTLKPRRDPSVMWPIVLGIEQGQRYRFRRRPTNDAVGIDKQLVVEQVSHASEPANHVTRLQLSLADPTAYWRLEVAGYGELDSTTRLAY
jgi:hypothetical protein